MEQDIRPVYGDLSDPQYTVGEVAILLGVHPQTVRYFDKTGIVSPERRDTNGRRIYTAYEVHLLTLRRQYQNMGFSVAETDRVFKEYNLEELLRELKEKEKEQRKRIQREKWILQGTEQLQRKMENIPLTLGRCFFHKRPAMWRHRRIQDSVFCDRPNSVKAEGVFLSLMPLSFYSFSVPLEEIRTGVCKGRIWDMAIPPEAAEASGYPEIPGSIFLPEELCVHTVFQITGTAIVGPFYFQYALDFIHQNDLAVSGDIYGSLIININQDGQQIRYFDAWIPVSPKE